MWTIWFQLRPSTIWVDVSIIRDFQDRLGPISYCCKARSIDALQLFVDQLSEIPDQFCDCGVFGVSLFP